MSTGATANETVPPGGNAAQASDASAVEYTGAEKQTTGTEEVGWYFVEQYYTTLNKNPDKLHLFYSKESSLVWGLEGEITPMAQGRTQISDKIKSLNFIDCKVRVTNVDSQSSIQGGIMVQVLGQMSNNSEPNRRFSQTFFLAEQRNGFFVLNDIFRYLKEDDEEEEPEIAPETAGEETAAEQPQIETLPADEPVVEVVEEKKPDSIETPAEEPAEKKETVPEVEEPAVNGKDKAEESAAAPAAAAPTATEESTPLVVTPAVPVITTPPPPSSARRTPTPQPEKAAESEETKPAAAAAAAAAPEEAKALSPAPPETKAPATNGSGTSTPPVPAAPPKPAAPRTWATLVASSGPKPPVAPAAVSTAGPAAGTSTPPAAAAAASKPPADAAPAANAQGSAPGTPVTPSGGAGGGWQTTESSRRSRPVSMVGPAEGQTQAYIKHVNERVSPGLLKEALTKFGALKHFDVVKQKNCAFVDFADASGFAAAVAANPHKINDQVLYVEERKPRGAGSSYPGGRGDRGGAPGGRGDRGSMGGRGGGFPRSNTGDRFEGGRGGMGGRGQGRGTYPRGGGRGGAAQS